MSLLYVTEVASKCNLAEWWVHCRHHNSGHQLHYDSDETAIEDCNSGAAGETAGANANATGAAGSGKGKPRHPLVSCVVYLDGNDGNNDINSSSSSSSSSSSGSSGMTGGPTMVTNQRLGGPLATLGWLCYPAVGRVCAFDASFLHGVLPGRGPTPAPPTGPTPTCAGASAGAGASGGEKRRRLTFMVGFWESIHARYRGGPGPAQPLPQLAPAGTPPDDDAAAHQGWLRELHHHPPPTPTVPTAAAGAGTHVSKPTPIAPPAVTGAIWEPIDADGGSSSSTSGGSGVPVGVRRTGASLKLEGLHLPGYSSCFQGF